MIIITPQKNIRCSQCGSRLILVKKIAAKDNFSKITMSTYRCSNESCQEGIDRKTKARIKLQSEHDLAKENRIKLKMRLNKKKILR